MSLPSKSFLSSAEPHPDPQYLTRNPDPSKNTSSGVDYEPHPENSIPLSAERQRIVDSICHLYSGGASEELMKVYAEKAIYDDPFSYCDTRYKIAGQWYGMIPPFPDHDPALLKRDQPLTNPGIPMIFSSSKTLATEVLKSDDKEIVFKLRQEYTPIMLPTSKVVNSLVSLALAKEGEGEGEQVVYHKDMWNEKDYSHEGLGMAFKKLNGDHLTKITKPPDSL